MHPEDYAQQIAAGYFSMLCTFIPLGLAAIFGIWQLIEKIINKRGKSEDKTNE